jgi:hypothetical protein
MAISQLITTIDGTKVGINATPAVNNAVALGSGQNVGVGTLSPLAGLHIGNSGDTVPALYLKDAVAATLPTIASGDGAYSVVSGQPTFTNSAGAQTLFAVDNIALGNSTLVAGTVTVTNAIVTTTTKIFISRTGTQDVINIGTLSVTAGTGSFTVDSTVVTDIGTFDYLIIV